MNERQQASLEVLTEIRSMMHKSSRFLSLSGWSGIWAGITALVASGVAYSWLTDQNAFRTDARVDIKPNGYFSDAAAMWSERLLILAVLTFVVAFLGALFFTWRKNKKAGEATFTGAARKLAVSMMIPMGAAACFILFFILNHHFAYIVPASLVFYGLTLINSSKYTFSDIRYLGLSEVIIGCIALFIPDMGLYLWALGFGIMHIVYGTIMWFKYDRKVNRL
jgi:hypothetical protein